MWGQQLPKGADASEIQGKGLGFRAPEIQGQSGAMIGNVSSNCFTDHFTTLTRIFVSVPSCRVPDPLSVLYGEVSIPALGSATGGLSRGQLLSYSAFLGHV